MKIILNREVEDKIREEIKNFGGFMETLSSEYPKYTFHPIGTVQMSVNFEDKTFYVEGREDKETAYIENITPVVVVTAKK